MLYYDTRMKKAISPAEFKARGLDKIDLEILEQAGIYPLTIETPEYDPAMQGSEPDGEPVPDGEDGYVQRMRVYDLLHRLKERKRADATALRWAHETGGISLFERLPQPEVPPLELPDDLPDEDRAALERDYEEQKAEALKPRYTETRILTGIDDQNRISTALQGMRDNGMTEVDFKSASGWMKLTLEELQQIASVIAVHVQACFSNERRLHATIDACATLEELNAIDLEEGWPQYRAPAGENAPEVE